MEISRKISLFYSNRGEINYFEGRVNKIKTA